MQKRGCESRYITAYGVRIEGNCYTSRLSIMISDSSMNNDSVQCFFTNGTSIAVGLSYTEITKVYAVSSMHVVAIHADYYIAV